MRFAGVGYQPWLLDDPDSTLIRFNVKDKSSYAKYVGTLKEYLRKYENITATRKCTGSQSNADQIKDGSARASAMDGSDEHLVEVSGQNPCFRLWIYICHLLIMRSSLLTLLYDAPLNDMSKPAR